MKKKKILILTSEYPDPNSTYETQVVHYYAKEWIQMGFELRVIHYRSVFPSIFYFFARILRRSVEKIFQTDFIPYTKLNSRVEYNFEGVNVIRQPIFKIFPHVRFFRRTIKKQARLVHADNNAFGFIPDIIIGHFVNPQLPLIAELKSYYPNVKSSLVFHENPIVISRLFGNQTSLYLEKIDYLGFRFAEMKNAFVSIFGKNYKLFICPSGIPDQYILPRVPTEKFKNEKISFCFTGMLIPLKNIDIILEAINLAFPNKKFYLKIYGKGMLRQQLEKRIKELKLEDCVSLEGKVPRDEIQSALANIDVFVMVSKPEAFGLVYVEAMGKGCITIGTKGQGIDGVIKNNENGFLCEARNIEELKSLFEHIRSMRYEDKIFMAKNALETASGLTDRKVAISYLEKIEAL